jgi:hypothetical protein
VRRALFLLLPTTEPFIPWDDTASRRSTKVGGLDNQWLRFCLRDTIRRCPFWPGSGLILAWPDQHVFPPDLRAPHASMFVLCSDIARVLVSPASNGSRQADIDRHVPSPGRSPAAVNHPSIQALCSSVPTNQGLSARSSPPSNASAPQKEQRRRKTLISTGVSIASRGTDALTFGDLDEVSLSGGQRIVGMAGYSGDVQYAPKPNWHSVS